MSQTAYSESLTQSIPGGIAEDLKNEVVTRQIPAGADPIPYGRAVEYVNTGDDHIKIYEGGTIQGVTVRDLGNPNEDGEWVEKDTVPVLSNGKIWVLVDDDVTAESDVFVRSAVEPEVFTVTFDIDFVASNVINGSVDGQAIAPVTFSVDQATTIAALATAIQNLANVATATVTDTKEITVTGATDGEMLSDNTDFTVTGGVSQPTDTEANVTGPTASGNLGVFRADDDDVGNGATAIALTQAKFRTTASAGSLAMLEINLP